MTSTPALLAGKLKSPGYELYLEGDKVKYRYALPGDPPADKVKPLLDELRNHKEDVITHLRFKQEFGRLAGHLKSRDYTPKNRAKLHPLASEMDQAWEALDYPKFKEAITEMMDVPGTLRSEGSKPIAAKIYSHILQDTVWVALAPTFQTDDGIAVYTPEEVRGLRGASPEDIRAVHRVKRELGGHLVSVKGEIS